MSSRSKNYHNNAIDRSSEKSVDNSRRYQDNATDKSVDNSLNTIAQGARKQGRKLGCKEDKAIVNKSSLSRGLNNNNCKEQASVAIDATDDKSNSGNLTESVEGKEMAFDNEVEANLQGREAVGLKPLSDILDGQGGGVRQAVGVSDGGSAIEANLNSLPSIAVPLPLESMTPLLGPLPSESNLICGNNSLRLDSTIMSLSDGNGDYCGKDRNMPSLLVNDSSDRCASPPGRDGFDLIVSQDGTGDDKNDNVTMTVCELKDNGGMTEASEASEASNESLCNQLLSQYKKGETKGKSFEELRSQIKSSTSFSNFLKQLIKDDHGSTVKREIKVEAKQERENNVESSLKSSENGDKNKNVELVELSDDDVADEQPGQEPGQEPVQEPGQQPQMQAPNEVSDDDLDGYEQELDDADADDEDEDEDGDEDEDDDDDDVKQAPQPQQAQAQFKPRFVSVQQQLIEYSGRFGNVSKSLPYKPFVDGMSFEAARRLIESEESKTQGYALYGNGKNQRQGCNYDSCHWDSMYFENCDRPIQSQHAPLQHSGDNNNMNSNNGALAQRIFNQSFETRQQARAVSNGSNICDGAPAAKRRKLNSDAQSNSKK